MSWGRRRGETLQLSTLGLTHQWLTTGSAQEGTRLEPRSALAALRRSGVSPRSVWGFMCRAGLADGRPRSASEQWRRVESALRFGQMSIFERPRALSRHSHEYPDEPDLPAPPAPTPEPIQDRELALMISRCDPELGAGPLEFTYLVRGLAGQPTTLQITSKSFPGGIVHQRSLAPAETTDGAHDGEWDGMVSTPGDLQGQRLPARYSPAQLEIRHDDTYRDQAVFTIPRPKVVLVEIGGLCFDTDREVLLPDVIPLADAEPGPARVPAIVAIVAVIRFAHAHPEKSIFVAGHSDTVGRDIDNQALSAARARNVQFYLSGDSDGWTKHCLDNYETADQQRILAWISRTFPEFDCDPGTIDGDMGPITRAAQNSFRQQYADQAGTTAAKGDALRKTDWRAFSSLYDRAVQAALGGVLDLETERSRLKFPDPLFAGFGESFPSDRPDLDDLESERNRRVEVIFLDEAELPLVDDTSGEALYGEQAGVLREYIPLGFVAGRDEIAFRFVDEFDEPVSGLEFELEGPDGTVIRSSADHLGESRITELLRGTHRLRLLGVDAMDWESIDIDQRQLPAPPTQREDHGYVAPEEGANGPIDEAALELVFDNDDD